jgi:streptogramin lyase
MANFATLANVLAGAVTQIKPDATRRFLAAATPRSGKVPTDTLTALEGVARDSGYKPGRLFALLDEFYPVPKGKNLRPVPFMPYLSWAPSAWVLPLKFDGGGLSAPGKMMIDSRGNVWAGDNFIVGFQNQDSMWAGNLSKFAPNGRPLSPMTTGYTGGGLQGVGFGMAIDADDNVWATCYASRTIAKFDKNGKPLSPPEGYNFGGRLGLMQGIIVTPGGDVWACDIEKSQMVYMPKGDPSRGKLLFQNKTGNPKDNPGRLSAPFHLAVDQQDRIWVSNFVSDWVTRFPASDPTRVETFKTGFSPGGMAIDSKGNVWIASHFGTSKRGPAIFAKVLKVMKAGGNYDPVLVRAMVETRAGPEGGCITILRPDGREAPGSPVSGNGLIVPWAVAVDGNDHIWVSNFFSATAGIVELAGCRPEANPPGLKMGDPISPPAGYVGGGMQMLIDIDIDPAGNVWVGNNWNNYEAALGRVAEPLQMQGAGQGIVCFYGMARPVRTPLIGPARPSN